MPVATREAMLDGIRSHEIIAGAYSDRAGGVCPMLAAHRNGGRTDFLSFAKSWDRFARAKHGKRQATVREVRILIDILEASVAQADGLDLDVAIAEHHALVGAEHRPRAALGHEADPRGPIRARRLRAAVRRLRKEQAAPEQFREPALG